MSDFLERRMIKVEFDTAANDSLGVANTTVAAHPIGVFIPDNSIVLNAFYEVETTFTSAADTATIAIHIEGAGDVVAAIAINDASDPFDDNTGAGEGIFQTIVGLPNIFGFHASNNPNPLELAIRKEGDVNQSFIKVADVEEVTFTVAVQALTAGKLHLYIEYVTGI